MFYVFQIQCQTTFTDLHTILFPPFPVSMFCFPVISSQNSSSPLFTPFHPKYLNEELELITSSQTASKPPPLNRPRNPNDPKPPLLNLAQSTHQPDHPTPKNPKTIPTSKEKTKKEIVLPTYQLALADAFLSNPAFLTVPRTRMGAPTKHCHYSPFPFSISIFLLRLTEAQEAVKRVWSGLSRVHISSGSTHMKEEGGGGFPKYNCQAERGFVVNSLISPQKGCVSLMRNEGFYFPCTLACLLSFLSRVRKAQTKKRDVGGECAGVAKM